MMASSIVEVGIEESNFQLWLGFLLSFLLFVVSFLNLKSVFWSSETKKKVECINKLPGPPTLPLVGNLHQCAVLLNSETEFYGWTRDMVKKFGPVFRVWNFGRPIIFIASSDLAIKLQKEGVVDDKCQDLKEFAVAINGIGLTALSLDNHAKHRKFWNPTFNWRQIESFLPFMHMEGIKTVNDLEKFVWNGSSSTVFDILPYAIRATFNLTCCTAFGKDFMNTVSDDSANHYIHDLHTATVNLTQRAVRPWLNKDFVYYNTPNGWATKRSADRGASLMKEAIAFRQQKRKIKDQSNGYICFLDRLLDLHEQGAINDTQLVGELNVFVASGYDTSATVIAFVMYFLAIYPEHQEKIVQELHDTLGPDFSSDVNYPLTWDTVKMFRHMELCIKESMRLHPLVPALPRRTTQDIKLDDGRVIPGEVDTFILTDIIHRDPKYFEEPDVFEPERHSGAPIPAYMPFSLGNRNCVGQVLGMVTVKTIVAHMLMRYIWETTETKEGFKTLFQTLQVPASVKCKIRKRTIQNNV